MPSTNCWPPRSASVRAARKPAASRTWLAPPLRPYLRIHLRSSSEQASEQALCLALDHDSAAAGSQDSMHFLRAAEALLWRQRVQHVTDHDDIERVGIEGQHGPGCRERLDEMTVSLDGGCRSRRHRRARIHDNRSTGQPGLAGQGADEGGIASAQHQQPIGELHARHGHRQGIELRFSKPAHGRIREKTIPARDGNRGRQIAMI